MLNFLNPPKSLIFTPTHLIRFKLSSIQISSSSIPTHQHIAQLILDEKTPSKAFQTFEWASKISNFHHNQSTYKALIQKLCSFRQFDAVNRVLHNLHCSIGSPPDEDTFIVIIRAFGRNHMAKEAIGILNLISHLGKNPSLKIYNSILDVLVTEDIDLARNFFRKKMMGCGIKGDDYTYGILMKGLCLTNRIDEGFKLLQSMKHSGLTPNTVIYNTLIHGLCKNDKVGRGRSLMNEMVHPNGVTFNILISGYCREGGLIHALVLLEKCFSLGFVPDVVTVTKVVEILCNEGRVTEAVEVLDRVEKKGGVVDTVTYNTLIKGFCRLGKVKVGKRVLKEMERKGCQPNVSTYNALISGLCDSGDLDLGLELFHEMQRDGLLPDFVTYDTLIRGLCLGGRVEDGFTVLNIMEERQGQHVGKISPYNSILYGLYRENRFEEAYECLKKMETVFPRAINRSLSILGFCKEGKIEEAKMVYDQMVSEGGAPSVLVYIALIDVFCKGGNMKEAFEMVNEMVCNSYLPVVSTYNALIGGFCKEGRVKSGLNLMEEMMERGSFPNTGTYGLLIDGICEEGRFERSFGLLVQMVDKGLVPDRYIWNSLLLYLTRENVWRESESSHYVDNLLNIICES